LQRGLIGWSHEFDGDLPNHLAEGDLIGGINPSERSGAQEQGQTIASLNDLTD